jgi:hypothetical protein
MELAARAARAWLFISSRILALIIDLPPSQLNTCWALRFEIEPAVFLQAAGDYFLT